MTAALAIYCILAVVSFLAAATVTHLLSKNGFAWIVVAAIAGSAVIIAALFPSSGGGPAEDSDFLVLILTWSLVFPALAGAILGGLVGAIKKIRSNR